ncbi:MAG: cell division protein [Pseudomonadota bacterium]|nr:cell division protein [Pseudomonadota bacterium]
MTDLQMSLIAAGGVLIVGVISYNKWQEYKARKSVERAFATDHDDVLMRTDGAPVVRQEPMLDLGTSPAAIEPMLAPAAAPPVAPGTSAGESQGEAEPEPAVISVPVSPAPTELADRLVDPLIDCLIPLVLEGAVRGDKVLPVLQTLRLVGTKPVHFIGLAVSGDWEPIVHGGVYTKLQAGVQMATRTTALNEIEYSDLVTRLRTLADEIGAEPEVPDMIDVMAEARTLHRFVAGHDAQLGVNLLSNGSPWAISTLIGALENQGFDVRPDGRFAMPDGEGGLLFTLTTNVTLGADSTSRLTLLLDVPCVAPARDGFGAMVACAKSLVSRLDATIVDDSDQPLLDPALHEINGQVLEFYQEMEASDIPAGSNRAMRLFS